MIAASAGGRVVSARARELAARLSALFERDVEIVKRVNEAQRRLRDANERLWSGLSPDAFGLIYDGSGVAGESQIAALIADALSAGVWSESRPAVLGALQRTHWAIHHAVCELQLAWEERRQLAVDVGELSQQLTDVLCAAGFSKQDALSADVHQLSGRSVECCSSGVDVSRGMSPRSMLHGWEERRA